MSDEKKQQPLTTLELQYMVTSPAWGNEASTEFKNKVSKSKYLQGPDGKVFVEQTTLWDMLSMFTRDIRLSNLSKIDGEMEYVRYYLDLSADLLSANMQSSFVTSLKLAVTVMETSQAKGGFLRRMLNTLRQEQQQELLEPKRKTFFGGEGKK